MNRRHLLVGTLIGVGLGFGASKAATFWESEAQDPAPKVEDKTSKPKGKVPFCKKRPIWVKQSVAQQGEDLVLRNIFTHLRIRYPEVDPIFQTTNRQS